MVYGQRPAHISVQSLQYINDLYLKPTTLYSLYMLKQRIDFKWEAELMKNTTDETGDSYSVICGQPKSHMCLASQLPANNYQKLSEGEGITRLAFSFCVAHRTHRHE